MENKKDIPANAAFILDKLEENGFEGYVVGGCVRDRLLGIEPKDWDITTNALPEQVKAVFDALDNCHTVDTGIQHGTVTVVIDHTGYEVTTYRIDGEYTDNRHPESVVFTDKITGDLARRDFTMNAIAYAPQKGYADPFDGRADIKRGLIRGVGDAAERFREDALRMMRALRFAAQLDFEIEKDTYAAVLSEACLIKNISTERIRDEFTKLIMTDSPQRIKDLADCGLLELFLPCVKVSEKMTSALEKSEKILPVRLAAVLYDVDEDINKLLKAMTYDNKTAKDTAMILRYKNMPEKAEAYGVRLLISKMGYECAKMLLEFKKAFDEPNSGELWRLFENIQKNGDCCTIKQLAITGEDLQNAGIPRGREIGALLEYALDTVMREPDKNEKEILLNKIKNERKK